MNNFLLNFIINVLLMAFGIISILELIYDKNKKGPLIRKIHQRGWALIVFAILSIVFNLYKDWSADTKQEASDKAKETVDSLLRASQKEILTLQLSIKDSIFNKVESSYANSIKSSNEALAIYNLKITDSLHAVVSTLKINALNPQILLAPLEQGKQSAYLGKDNDKNTFYMQFISKGGTSYHVLIDCYIVEQGYFGFTSLQSYRLSIGESFIAEGVLRTKSMVLSSDVLTRPNLIVFLTGSFSKDPQGEYIIPFHYAFNYNFAGNQYLGGLEINGEEFKRKLNIK